jgi:hypothetical protein
MDWIAIIPFIIGSTVIAAAVTLLGNYLVKERENYRNITKQKMESVYESKHYAMQLAFYYRELYHRFKNHTQHKKNIDCYYCLYCICNILRIDRIVLEEIGKLQFDDLEAERIIGKYTRRVYFYLLPCFDNLEKDKLVNVLKTDKDMIRYHQFYETLTHYNEYIVMYAKFEDWIKKMHPKRINELTDSTMVCSQVIPLEFNQIFEVWYKTGTTIKNYKNYDQLHEKVKTLLRSEKDYFNRIYEFDKETTWNKVKKISGKMRYSDY